MLEREAAGLGLHLRKSLLRAEGEKTGGGGLGDKGREGVGRTVVAEDGWTGDRRGTADPQTLLRDSEDQERQDWIWHGIGFQMWHNPVPHSSDPPPFHHCGKGSRKGALPMMSEREAEIQRPLPGPQQGILA